MVTRASSNRRRDYMRFSTAQVCVEEPEVIPAIADRTCGQCSSFKRQHDDSTIGRCTLYDRIHGIKSRPMFFGCGSWTYVYGDDNG